MAQLWWFDKEVTSVRDARAGDHGFVEGRTQVVVMLDDGTQYIVPRSEVTTTRAEVSRGLAPAPASRADDELVLQLRQIPHQLAHEAADRIATLTKHLAERERSDHG